jgi:hypothetical protein
MPLPPKPRQAAFSQAAKTPKTVQATGKNKAGLLFLFIIKRLCCQHPYPAPITGISFYTQFFVIINIVE